jgi:hypothetical protein
MARGFRCAGCGEWHDELLLDFAFDEPLYVADLARDDRARFVKGTGDFRELLRDGETHFFIRGLIEIPILETDSVFSYGVWTSLSAASYAAATAAYREQTEAGPFFGWLSNALPEYPSTVNLKTMVHVRPRIRAAIELEPTDHPLAVEQREGITLGRVEQIVATVMHP